jgi:hypothetical protein
MDVRGRAVPSAVERVSVFTESATATMVGRVIAFMERPLLGGVVVLDAQPRHLAHFLVHPDDEAKEDRPTADVGAVARPLLGKRIAFRVGERESE